MLYRYLNNFLKSRAILMQFRTSDAIILDEGNTKHVFNYRSFSSVVPRALNILPCDLRKLQSSYCFTHKLKIT